MASWTAQGKRHDHVQSIAPETLPARMTALNTVVVDVRKPSEFANGHLIGAKHQELDFLESKLDGWDKEKQYVVHCQGGYRSMIAVSIMKAHGFHHIENVSGGFGAISKTEIPIGSLA
jgi:rhodanese-related sulfurtransferase